MYPFRRDLGLKVRFRVQGLKRGSLSGSLKAYVYTIKEGTSWSLDWG